jgi:hypothetical protein
MAPSRFIIERSGGKHLIRREKTNLSYFSWIRENQIRSRPTGFARVSIGTKFVSDRAGTLKAADGIGAFVVANGFLLVAFVYVDAPVEPTYSSLMKGEVVSWTLYMNKCNFPGPPLNSVSNFNCGVQFWGELRPCTQLCTCAAVRYILYALSH